MRPCGPASGAKPFGSVDTSWGSFGTWSGSVAFGMGTAKFGNFFVVNAR